PAITVLGRAKGYGNLVDPPRDEPLPRPLLAAVKAATHGHVWTSHLVLNGRPKSVGRLAVHFSLLQPGHSPHAPHAHVDEEILVLIDGEAEVVLPKSQADPSPSIHRLR